MNCYSARMIGALVAVAGQAQVVAPTPAALSQEFRILESQKPRQDLECAVTPVKPILALDFKFHSGYHVVMPVMTSNVAETKWTVVYHIVPRDYEDKAVYLWRKVEIPSITIDWHARKAAFDGEFVLGEGQYHIDWMVRDEDFHVCSTSWDVDSRLESKESSLRPWIEPGLVEPVKNFEDEVPSARKAGAEPLKLSIIVNLAPQDPDSMVLAEKDLMGLIEMLRPLARDPDIEINSLVACSVRTQKVLLRQERGVRVDFPGIGEALKLVQPGLVDAKQLFRREDPADFVANLIQEQSRVRDSEALIFIGPGLSPQTKISQQLLTSLDSLNRPIFYLTYRQREDVIIWRDLIGNIVKRKRGCQYTITRPKDLFRAWSDITDRIKARRAESLQDRVQRSGSAQ